MKIGSKSPDPVSATPSAVYARNAARQPATASETQSSSLIAGTGAAASAAKIMQKFDLQNASYSEVQSMGKELYDAGAITGDQLMTITAPVFDRFDLNMNRISSPTEKRDYLQETQQLLNYTKANQPGDKSSIQNLERLSNYLQSLASLRG